METPSRRLRSRRNRADGSLVRCSPQEVPRSSAVRSAWAQSAPRSPPPHTGARSSRPAPTPDDRSAATVPVGVQSLCKKLSTLAARCSTATPSLEGVSGIGLGTAASTTAPRSGSRLSVSSGRASVQPCAGYAEYLVTPHPGDLAWACGAVPTPSGPIRVSWEQADGMLTVWFDAPSGTSGRFVAPPAASDQALVDGAPAELVQLSSSELGLAGLPSGPHTIRVQLHATQEGNGTRRSA